MYSIYPPPSPLVLYNHPHLSDVPPLPLHVPLPPPLPPNNTPFVSLTNPASSYPTCGCSLQWQGCTALAMASHNGNTEIAQALLAAAGIDVNHADVSIYPLTPSHVVVGGEAGGGLPPLFLLILTLELMSYHPLTSKMYPITSGKKRKWYFLIFGDGCWSSQCAGHVICQCYQHMFPLPTETSYMYPSPLTWPLPSSFTL